MCQGRGVAWSVPAYAEARMQRLEDSPTTQVIEKALAGHTVDSALALLAAHRVAAESPRLITNNEAIRLPMLFDTSQDGVGLERAVEDLKRRAADAVEAGYRALVDFVASKKVSYDELMFTLARAA